MGFSLGANSIDNVMKGSDQVDKIYLGTDEIWSNSSFAPAEVTIGTQTWMAVNLDIDDGGDGIYAYDDNESNVATYGRLYTWSAAVRVASSINGWHLPSRTEWTTLQDFIGDSSSAGGLLKEVGFTHWSVPNTGATDTYGFTVLPSGFYEPSTETSYALGTSANFWTDTEYDATFSYVRAMTHSSASLIDQTSFKEDRGFSIRLIKD